MFLIQSSITAHPLSDLIVGIPLGSLFIWAAKILYETSNQLKETRTILFGLDTNTPGELKKHEDEIKSAHRKLHRHSSVLQALVTATKIDIPEKLDE